MVAVMPALGGVIATIGAQHPAATEADLEGNLIDRGVAGRHVTGHQPRVVMKRRQQIAGTEVAGADALLPRQPLWGKERRRTRNQHHLTDRRPFGPGVGGNHHGPLPALITRHGGQEPVGGRGFVLKCDAEVVPDGVAAELDDRLARKIGRSAQECSHSGRRLRRRGRGFRGVDLGVHR